MSERPYESGISLDESARRNSDATVRCRIQLLLPILLSVTAMLMLPGCAKSAFDEHSNATVKATKGTLLITVNNPGTVSADKQINILNELKYWASIKSVREEGEFVKQGDQIIEFECRQLKTQLETKELELDSSQLTLEQALSDFTIQKKQLESDLLQAENGVKTARENLAAYEKVSRSNLARAQDRVVRARERLNRYIEKGGVWENSLNDADNLIRMSRKKMEIEQDKLGFKIKINRNPELESPYSKTEIEGHTVLVKTLEDALEKAIRARKLLIEFDHPNTQRQLEMAVTQAVDDLAILEEFTIPQTFRTLKAALAEAELNLDKTRTNQEATLALKEFEIKGKETIVKKVRKSLAELQEEEEDLRLEAKVDGLILYRPGWLPGGTRQIEAKEGERLYPKAKLFEIPDLTTLMVKTELLDSLNIHLQRGGKAGGGTEASFTLDAYPGRTFVGHVLDARPTKRDEESEDEEGGLRSDVTGEVTFKGHVLKTSPLPKDTGTFFMKSGVSAYDVLIEVDWGTAGLVPGEHLKPGMSCQVTLALVSLENVLTIPVVSLYSRENVNYCRKIVDGVAVEQPIKIGLRNESRVQVLEGLAEGDEIQLVGDADGAAASSAIGGR